jgi:ribosome-associated heat shock protein Hsp15
MAAEEERQVGAKGSQRLDKWLWFARLTKSRTMAATAVCEGKIRVNRERVDTPSRPIKIGDVVTSRVHRTIRVWRVVALGEKRGPASEAAKLYEDLTPSSLPLAATPPEIAARAGWGEREPGAGRPTKKERRRTDFLKGTEK